MTASSPEGPAGSIKPENDDLVELKNGRLVDVVNGRFFEPGRRLLIQNGRIVAMPGAASEFNADTADFTVDLQGKTVLPGLFNVHCHLQMINPTVLADWKTIKARKRLHDRQVEKNLSDCLKRGITHVRDAFSENLKPNRECRDRITRGEISGPRIIQAVAVGARGGYLTPDLRGMKKVMLGRLGLGGADYDDPETGAVVFPAGASASKVRDAVDRAIDERGADLIKVGESLEQSLLNPQPFVLAMNQLEAITDQARRRGVQSTIHAVSRATFRRALKAGFTSLAHMARDDDFSDEEVRACRAAPSTDRELTLPQFQKKFL
jgi:imidazolonepropionase-like amidohydrolase